jgi:hypothetical protein
MVVAWQTFLWRLCFGYLHVLKVNLATTYILTSRRYANITIWYFWGLSSATYHIVPATLAICVLNLFLVQCDLSKPKLFKTRI